MKLDWQVIRKPDYQRFVEASYISEAEALRWCEAWAFAYCSSKPLNWFVTIRLTTAYTDKPFEKPAAKDDLLAGLHAHLFFHLPNHLQNDFRKQIKGWRKKAGMRFGRGMMDMQPGWHAGNPDQRIYLNGDCTRPGYLGLMRYCLKALPLGVAERFGCIPKDQGAIGWKRMGLSEALGPRQRLNAEIALSPAFQSRLANLKALCPRLAGYANPAWTATGGEPQGF